MFSVNDIPKYLQKSPIVILPNQTLCTFHKQLFLSKWPRGHDIYFSKGLRFLNRNAAFVSATHDSPQGVIVSLNVKPMCCWLLGNELWEMLQEVEEAESKKKIIQDPLWPIAECGYCHKTDFGAPYVPFVCQKQAYEHLCIRCFSFQS